MTPVASTDTFHRHDPVVPEQIVEAVLAEKRCNGHTPDWVNRVRLVLSLLDKAARPEDANVPGLNFHPLTGGQAGRFSILVSRNWRITFAWDDSDAIDVHLEDYHG